MAAAMGGGGFSVVNQATQGFTEEAIAAIVSQIIAQINAKFADFLCAEGQDYLNTLPEILSFVRTLKAQVAALATEQATLTEQLNSRMPEIGTAQASLDSPAATLR